ncbi:MAG: hypothetical protein P1P78_13950 [Methyloprofundus sp.]|nr:hypothetical protein [Methyloprofundus sp.]
MSIWLLRMNFTLLDDTDVSQAYAAYLRELRKRKTVTSDIGRAQLCTCGYH